MDNGFFNPQRAGQCMEIAAAAYLDDADLARHLFRFADKVDFITNEETDTQVLLGHPVLRELEHHRRVAQHEVP
jgi:hypothetical protein